MQRYPSPLWRPFVVSVLALACRPGGNVQPDGTDDDSAPPTETDTEDTETDPVDTTDGPTPQALVLARPLRTCSTAGQPPRAPFTTVRLPVERTRPSYMAGAGVGVGDVDGDGDLDLLAVGRSLILLFRQDAAGAFAEEEVLSETHSLYNAWYGPALADVDGDGDLDAYVSGYNVAGVLLRNDGTGGFTNVTEGSGIHPPEGHYAGSPAWADMDLDGDLDLVIAGHGFVPEAALSTLVSLERGSATLLFEQQADGTFEDVSSRIDPAVDHGYAFNAAFLDLDGDPYPDLYIAQDFGETRFASRALVQRDGRFVAEAAPSGLLINTTAMGLGVGDVNGDGVVDLVFPGWNKLSVLVSNAGTWFDAAAAMGVTTDAQRNQGIGWGSDVGDIDNDGDADFVIGFGDLQFGAGTRPTFLGDQQDAVFLQGPSNAFVDVAPSWDLDDPGNTRAYGLVDLNGDGSLDVVRHAPEAGVRVDLSACQGEARAAVIALHDPSGRNPDAIGARITVRAGGRSTVRWVLAGSASYAFGHPPEVHVGLADAQTIDGIDVRWPDGVTHALGAQPVGHRLDITRVAAP